MATETITVLRCDRCLKEIPEGERCSDISVSVQTYPRGGSRPGVMDAEEHLEDLCRPCGKAVRRLWNSLVLKRGMKFDSLEDLQTADEAAEAAEEEHRQDKVAEKRRKAAESSASA